MSTSNINQELVDYAYTNLNNIPRGAEYEKMISSQPYDMYDKQLHTRRVVSHELALDYANIRLGHYDSDLAKHQQARIKHLQQVFGHVEDDAYIEPPFYVDYGSNVKLGRRFYSNFNTIFLDCTIITFGDNVMVGPNCTFTTATHPTDPQQRLDGVEYAKPITVGNNVWFGCNVVVLPGVTIGDNAVVGAGSVVNRNVEANAVVVGVPAKVVKIMHSQREHDEAIGEFSGGANT